MHLQCKKPAAVWPLIIKVKNWLSFRREVINKFEK